MALGLALCGLERLPLPTPGLHVEFGAILVTDYGHSGGTSYFTYTLSDDTFKVDRGGHEWTREVGGDSYTSMDWIIDIDGNRQVVGHCEPVEWEQAVDDLLVEGGLCIENLSTINAEDLRPDED